MDARSGSIGARSHHRSRHHRRKDDRTLDYESSEGEDDGGRAPAPLQRQEFNLNPFAYDPNIYSRKRQTLPSSRDRNSLALTADETHISPIDNLDVPVQRLYSYLSGSDGEGSPCVPKLNNGAEWQEQRSRTSSDSSLGSQDELPPSTRFAIRSEGSHPTNPANTLGSRTGENFYSRISDDSEPRFGDFFALDM